MGEVGLVRSTSIGKTLVSRSRSSLHSHGYRTNFAIDKDTSKSKLLVWLMISKSALEYAASMKRTSKSPH